MIGWKSRFLFPSPLGFFRIKYRFLLWPFELLKIKKKLRRIVIGSAESQLRWNFSIILWTRDHLSQVCTVRKSCGQKAPQSIQLLFNLLLMKMFFPNSTFLLAFSLLFSLTFILSTTFFLLAMYFMAMKKSPATHTYKCLIAAQLVSFTQNDIFNFLF